MKISVNQIENILEDNYQNYIKNKKYNNLLFVGMYDIGKSSVIERWAIKHDDFSLFVDCYPQQRYEENENGILEKQEEYIITDDALEKISNNKNVLFFRRINFLRDISVDKELVKLIRDDKYNTLFDNEYYLKTRMFTIATSYPNYQGNSNVSLSDELMSLFEVYEVETSCEETLQYLMAKYEDMNNCIINKSKQNEEDKEEFLFNENILSLINSIIDDKSIIEILNKFTTDQIETCLCLSKNKEQFLEILKNQ